MQCNNKICSGMAMLLLAWVAILPIVHAESSKVPAGIDEFAKCSRRCAAENEQCRQKLAKTCAAHDEDCYESCTVTYPACMAECPRPGSK